MAVYIEVSRRSPVCNASFGRPARVYQAGSCLNKSPRKWLVFRPPLGVFISRGKLATPSCTLSNPFQAPNITPFSGPDLDQGYSIGWLPASSHRSHGSCRLAPRAEPHWNDGPSCRFCGRGHPTSNISQCSCGRALLIPHLCLSGNLTFRTFPNLDFP